MLLASKTTPRLNIEEIKQLKKEYSQVLEEKSFCNLLHINYKQLLYFLKREKINIGPHKNITLYEAVNHIATDLTMIDGVLKLYSDKKISDNAEVIFRLGNKHQKGKGDFSIFEDGGEYQGEAFDVADSLFKRKLKKTLNKWKDSIDFKYIVFNEDCLSDKKCNSYFEKISKEKSPNVSILKVTSWQNNS